jgi:hypothetical protein
LAGKNAVRQRKGFSDGFRRSIAADKVRKTPTCKNIHTRHRAFLSIGSNNHRHPNGKQYQLKSFPNPISIYDA